ncbi:Dihydrolipoamide acetyltransferase component of pyruvate dehydrogenase complex [hydrothermal vent metagenome]|uniref:Dihydrolipoamide acetyltransferase component of pyruvate dehydrogenase complex n=1 Tax=hydrothermal vent metagenome TaxID=652676 RepID=A0A3B1E948_9ZZZZ
METDKATMELQSFDEGTVGKIVAAEGATVPIGSVICVLAEEGESLEAASASASGTTQAADGASTTVVADPPATKAADPAGSFAANADSSGKASANGQRIIASPLARKIAEERGIDLSTVQGSGPAGRITRKDVESVGTESAAPARPHASQSLSVGVQSAETLPVPTGPVTLEDKTIPLSNMRATIAKRLVESKTTVPHYQVTVSARVDALLELREQLNEQLADQGVKLSVNDFLVRACAVAMHEHPFVNASWDEGSGSGPSIRLHGRVNVGVAISLPVERGGGLVVATIREADRIGLRQISTETKRLAKKAREKGLTVEEMSDSTFTISNLGMFGVDHFTAIINPPNAAILAVGRAIEKPFVEFDEEGEPELVIGHEMSMTISSDHRVIDGAMAAQYLQTVKDLLEKPASLLV